MEIDLKIILSIIGSLFSSYFWLYSNTKTNLMQSLYREEKIKLIEAHTFEQKYKTKLQSLINWLDNIYNNATVIQNYSRHVTIALLYSFMVFLIFWVLGAEGMIGNIQILGDSTIRTKLQTLAFFVLYLIFIYMSYNKVNSLIKFIIKKLPKNSQKSNAVIPIITLALGILVAGVVMGIIVKAGLLGVEVLNIKIGEGVGGAILAVLGIVAVVGVGIVVEKEIKNVYQKISLLYLIWFLLLLFSSSFTNAMGIAFILTLLSLPLILLIKKIGLGLNLMTFGIMFLLFIAYNSPNEQQTIYILALFLILLPLNNSLLDYISLKISKYMAEQIMEDNSVLTVLVHLLADFIIAVILLIALALFLYVSVGGLNLFIKEPIPIKTMLVATWSDPFCVENGWITFMLLSTLVPTVVHIILALGALFIAIMPSEKSLKQLKMYNKGQEALLESAAHYFTRIAFVQTFFSFVILLVLSLPFWYDKV